MAESNGSTNGNGKVHPAAYDETKRQKVMDLIANTLSARMEFFRRIGGERRNIEAECGYEEQPSIPLDKLKNSFDRESIATRVVEIYPKECWQVTPTVYEAEDTEEKTPFEEAWDRVGKKLRGERSKFKDEKGSPVWDILKRADIVSGIGHFGLVLLGIDDGLPLSSPAAGVEECRKVSGVVPLGADAQYAFVGAPTGSNGVAAPKGEDPAEELRKDIPATDKDKDPEESPEAAKKREDEALQKEDLNAVEGKTDPNEFGDEDDEELEEEDELDDEELDDKIEGLDIPVEYVLEGEDLAEKAKKMEFKNCRNLLFMRVFDETQVQISQFDSDTTSPRFGMPVMYRINFNDPNATNGGGFAAIGMTMQTQDVHWTRVLHIADNLLTNEVFGVPRQQAVYNRICDLKKVYGAAGEGYWKGAFAGLALSTHPQLGGEVDVDKADLKDQLENYFEGLERYLYLTGMSATTISPQVTDPTNQINICIEAICILLACPLRIFKGSERGELASSQDDGSWESRIKERRENYLTPRVIVALVDRLIAMGVLPEPEEYHVSWEATNTLNDNAKAQIASSKTSAMAQYQSSGLQALITPTDFFVRIMGMEEEEAIAIVTAAEEANAFAAEQQAMGGPQIDPLTGQPIPGTGMTDEFGNPIDELGNPVETDELGNPLEVSEEFPPGTEDDEEEEDEGDDGGFPPKKPKGKPAFLRNDSSTANEYTISEAVYNGRWITLESDQRVYIDDDGSFLPRGPGSKPVKASVRTIKLGDAPKDTSKAKSVYEAFGIKSPEQEAMEKKVFQTLAIPKIRAYEKSSNVPWIERLLKATEITHGTKGQGMQEKWISLTEGKLWGKSMKKLLADEDFSHDYGSMNQTQLKKLVELLKHQGYRSTSNKNWHNQAASNGMVSTLPPNKFKLAFGFTPGAHDLPIGNSFFVVNTETGQVYLANDCGTGKGGFKKGNSCATGSKGKSKKASTPKEEKTSPKGEEYWGSSKQPYWRPGNNPTVDNLITRDGPNGPEILLVKRKEGSVEGGKWALPGGFHDTKAPKGSMWKPGKETARQAALRELAEETGLEIKTLSRRLREVGSYEGGGRDPRDNDEAWGRSTAFKLHLPPELASKVVKGNDDAEDAKWFSISSLPTLAFDHSKMIKDAKLTPKPKAKAPSTTPEKAPVATPTPTQEPSGGSEWASTLFDLPNEVKTKAKTPAEAAKVKAYGIAKQIESKREVSEEDMGILTAQLGKMKLIDLREMKDTFALIPAIGNEKKAQLAKELAGLFLVKAKKNIKIDKPNPFGFLFLANELIVNQEEYADSRIELIGNILGYVAELTQGEFDLPLFVTNAGNCGTGAGGFQPGNTCATGSGGIPTNEAFAKKIAEKGFTYKGGPKGFKIATLEDKDYLIKSDVTMSRGREGSVIEEIVSGLAKDYRVDVAPVAVRMINNKEVTISEWVKDGKTLGDMGWEEKRAALSAIPQGEIARQVLFDYLVGNSDKHEGNYIIQGNKLVGIDKEFSLPKLRGTEGTTQIMPSFLRYATPTDNSLDFVFPFEELLHASVQGKKLADKLERMGRKEEAESMRDRIKVIEKVEKYPQRTAQILEMLGMFGGLS